LRDPGIIPSHSSPSVKVASIPLRRGDPSRRRVASTLCLWASRVFRARAASSGAAASTSLQLAMPPSLLGGQLERMPDEL
jgi:hypothetical protein